MGNVGNSRYRQERRLTIPGKTGPEDSGILLVETMGGEKRRKGQDERWWKNMGEVPKCK